MKSRPRRSNEALPRSAYQGNLLLWRVVSGGGGLRRGQEHDRKQKVRGAFHSSRSVLGDNGTTLLAGGVDRGVLARGAGAALGSGRLVGKVGGIVGAATGGGIGAAAAVAEGIVDAVAAGVEEAAVEAAEGEVTSLLPDRERRAATMTTTSAIKTVPAKTTQGSRRGRSRAVEAVSVSRDREEADGVSFRGRSKATGGVGSGACTMGNSTVAPKRTDG